MTYNLNGKNAVEYTDVFLKTIAEKYEIKNLLAELNNEQTNLREMDIYISLREIIDALKFRSENEEQAFEALKTAKNIYNSPIFALNYENKNFAIKKIPDLEIIIEKLTHFNKNFAMSIYHTLNTIIAFITAEIADYDLDDLFSKGQKHINDFIEFSLKNNSNWNKETLTNDNPKLIIPIGAAGCGKSTFYNELKNVVNISCDNVRYLLFSDFGPCFQAWESTLSWWVVNSLTDFYINKGYSVFYNGVNTDLQYRSPMTMEAHNPIFDGLKYNIKLVYFNPPAKLTDEELKELKGINLWAKDINSLDLNTFSDNVKKIMEMIKNNVGRTFSRTQEIRDGKKEQDPFDILYAVPAPVVKMFVEQNFDKPTSDNVIEIPRKEIPDEKERIAFYKSFAEKTLM